jgi:hypothetical protein
MYCGTKKASSNGRLFFAFINPCIQCYTGCIRCYTPKNWLRAYSRKGLRHFGVKIISYFVRDKNLAPSFANAHSSLSSLIKRPSKKGKVVGRLGLTTRFYEVVRLPGYECGMIPLLTLYYIASVIRIYVEVILRNTYNTTNRTSQASPLKLTLVFAG